MRQSVIRRNFLILIGILTAFNVAAQEVKHRSDYDLNGPVKKCTVLTTYGKEIYSFSKEGKLEQLISYFDDNNYQQITYSYKGSLLSERRIELYEMGTLDKSSSVINVYQHNKSPYVHKELIADYNGNTLENITYKYDSINRLSSLKKLTKNGLSTTLFSRSVDSLGVYKRLIYQDSIIKKRTDSIPNAHIHIDSLTQVRTVYYLDGFEDRAELKKYNQKGLMVYFKNELFLLDSNQWYRTKEEEYDYNKNGQMIEKISREGNTSFSQKFVYQNDGSTYQNWVKQIVMPNMTYTTRIIEYYEDN